ncbi:MAG: DUF2948 family protein [Devosiaceae bacterium]|nr:DUF2948 family protein [Devosiaceae bacterium MH13]
MDAETSKPLKLAAFDADDLAVVSAAVQDMIVKVGDMTYLPRDKRFALVGNRFAWEINAERKRPPYQRRRSGLQVTRVIKAERAGLRSDRPDDVLDLLSITFEPSDAPEGSVLFAFAGGASVRLHVECLELAMADLGGAWTTQSLPRHPDDAEADDSKT